MLDKNYYEGEVVDLEKLVNLESLEFINCEFLGSDISGRSLKNSKIIECHFNKCNLANLDLVGSSFRDVLFKNCKLLGTNWSHISSSFELLFEDCILNMCVFHNLDLRKIRFINCALNDSDFSQSKLQYSLFKNTELFNTVFNDADLSYADLNEARGYFIDPKFTKIKKAKFSMPEAMAFFEALGIEID